MRKEIVEKKGETIERQKVNRQEKKGDRELKMKREKEKNRNSVQIRLTYDLYVYH